MDKRQIPSAVLQKLTDRGVGTSSQNNVSCTSSTPTWATVQALIQRSSVRIPLQDGEAIQKVHRHGLQIFLNQAGIGKERHERVVG